MKSFDLLESMTHLLKPNYKQFISFCQQHENIATLFGSASGCNEKAVMCNKGCKKHRRYFGKHQYFQVQHFLKMIQQIRKQYRQFHRQYVYEALPAYVQKIKHLLKRLLQYFAQIDDQRLLLRNFFDQMPTQKIQTIITEDIDNWDINQLTCKDISSLQSSYSQVILNTASYKKLKIQNELDNFFIRVLSQSRIIPYEEKKIYQTKPEKFQEFEDLTVGINRMKQIEKMFIEDPNREIQSFSIKFSKEKKNQNKGNKKGNKKQEQEKQETNKTKIKKDEKEEKQEKQELKSQLAIQEQQDTPKLRMPPLNIEQIKIPSISLTIPENIPKIEQTKAEQKKIEQINYSQMPSNTPTQNNSIGTPTPQKIASINDFISELCLLVKMAKIQYIYLMVSPTIDIPQFWTKFLQTFGNNKIRVLHTIIILTSKKRELTKTIESIEKSTQYLYKERTKIIVQYVEFFKKVV